MFDVSFFANFGNIGLAWFFYDFYVDAVTRPLPRDGVMAENHGAPEAGQLSMAWTRGRKEIESCQRTSGARVHNRTVQNEMRGVRKQYPQALQEGFSILPILEK